MEIKGCEYRQECPVIFGLGVAAGIADKVKGLNGKKAICIYDGGVKASGIADKIIGYLKDGGIEVVTFDGVKPDPLDCDVDVVGDIARNEGADIVIGIGGGSPQDTAKIVGVLIKNPGKVSDYFLSKSAFPQGIAPVVLVPTASGTGSEVTRVAVVSEHITHAKDAVFASAALAIVDPELTVTAPPSVTAASGFDALAHAIESYTTPGENPMADLLAIEAIKLIAANLIKTVDDGKDIEARKAMAIASNFAGIAFNNTGVHFGHALGHELGSVFGLPHGLACAYPLPEIVMFAAEAAPQKVLNIAEAMNVEMPEWATAEIAGASVARAIRSMMRYCKIKTFTELDITREAAVNCAQGAIDHNGFYHNTLRPIPCDEFKIIIGKVYDGYQ